MSTAALHFESNSTGIDNYGNTVQNTRVVRGHLDNRVAILELSTITCSSNVNVMGKSVERSD